jgi:hypothetical protein
LAVRERLRFTLVRRTSFEDEGANVGVLFVLDDAILYESTSQLL